MPKKGEDQKWFFEMPWLRVISIWENVYFMISSLYRQFLIFDSVIFHFRCTIVAGQRFEPKVTISIEIEQDPTNMTTSTVGGKDFDWIT